MSNSFLEEGLSENDVLKTFEKSKNLSSRLKSFELGTQFVLIFSKWGDIEPQTHLSTQAF